MKRFSRAAAVILISNLFVSSFGFAADGREAPAAGAFKIAPIAVPQTATLGDLKAGAVIPEANAVAPQLDAALQGAEPRTEAPKAASDFGRAQAAVAPGVTPEEAAPRLDELYTGEKPAGAVDLVETMSDGQLLKIRVMGEATITPKENPDEPVHIIDHVYDNIIIGMGWAGISAAWGLRAGDNLHLEREPFTGGLAYGGMLKASGIQFVRGAAYITKPTGVVAKIWKSMGEPPIKTIAIKEPIDSRYQDKTEVFKKAVLVKGVWEEESLNISDPGFAAVHKELQRLEGEGYTDFNPPEKPPKKAEYLDDMTAYEFLKPYGEEVVAFMDSYCQSALGGHLDQISALAFILFYVDEIVTRYTWAKGTGGGIYEVVHKLAQLHKNSIRTRTHVREVVNLPDGLIQATYERDGKVYKVRARNAVVATPSKVAAKIVPQMPEATKKIINGLEYAHYTVATIKSKADLYKESYDTWENSIWFRQRGVPPELRKNNPYTDFIASRWTATDGFTRDLEGPGLIALYQPDAPPHAENAMAPFNVIERFKAGLVKLRERIPGLAKEKELEVEIYRWPSSIHQAKPGHLTKIGPLLEKSVGNIHFAHNNQGTPAFETAMLEGYDRSQQINRALKRNAKAFWLRKKDAPSSWKPATSLEIKAVEAALPWALEKQPKRAAEFRRRLKALARPAQASVSDRIIPEDHAAWMSLKEGDRGHLFVRLDGLELNAAVRAALAKGASEKSLYRRGSRIHKLAQRLLAPVEASAASLEKEGLRWAANYNFNASGSTVLVELAGTKGQIAKALDGAGIYKAWLGNEAQSLAGNELYMRDAGAYRNAVTGVSTVYLRKGADKGYKTGPGQIKNADGELLPVTFASVEEMPYSKVGKSILNSLADGLTWEEMFRTMQSYYPGFASDDIVTVIRYRRR